jgi:hypothetical protein
MTNIGTFTAVQTSNFFYVVQNRSKLSLCCMYPSPNVIPVMKELSTRRMGHEKFISNFVQKTRKEDLSVRRCEDNSKTEFTQMQCEDVDCVKLACNRAKQRPLVNTQWIFGFHKWRENWLAERLLAPQELRYMKFVTYVLSWPKYFSCAVGYFSSNIIWVIKSRMRWAGHVARRKIRIVNKIFVEKPELFGRPRRRWENNIKMDLKHQDLRMWTEGKGPVSGFCEQFNGSSGSIKNVKFLRLA